MRQTSPKGEASRFLYYVAMRHEGNECLLWPFPCVSSNYPQMRHLGKACRAHRVVCEMIHGPSNLQVRHLCGNKMCVSPHHLVWGTSKENAADRLLHGTSNKGKKYKKRVKTI